MYIYNTIYIYNMYIYKQIIYVLLLSEDGVGTTTTLFSDILLNKVCCNRTISLQSH